MLKHAEKNLNINADIQMPLYPVTGINVANSWIHCDSQEYYKEIKYEPILKCYSILLLMVNHAENNLWVWDMNSCCTFYIMSSVMFCMLW